MIVLSSLGLKGVLEKNRAQLGALELHFDATQAILKNLGSVRADLLVLTAEAMDDLKKKGLITETRALGSSGVGVAVRSGAPADVAGRPTVAACNVRGPRRRRPRRPRARGARRQGRFR